MQRRVNIDSLQIEKHDAVSLYENTDMYVATINIKQNI